MKKIISYLFITFVLLISVSNGVQSLKAYESDDYNQQNINWEERISKYKSTVKIQKDSTLDITEEITVYVNNQTINHGIYRDFPTIYQGQYGFRETLSLNVVSVYKEEILDDQVYEPKPEKYDLEYLYNGVRIKIGNGDITLSPGFYKYTINFRVKYLLGDFEEYDRLYYNIIGNGWNYEIENAEAEIYFPKKINSEDLKVNVYQGAFDSKEESDQINITNEKTGTVVYVKSSRKLSQYEGLTIYMTFPNNIINFPSDANGNARIFRDNLDIFLLLITLIIAITFALVSWRKWGKDPKKSSIIPIFTPPDNISPAGVGIIYHKYMTTSLMTASLISLGVKGYLRIEEINEEVFFIKVKKYKLTKLRDIDDNLAKEESQLMHNLFDKYKSFTIGDPSKSDDLSMMFYYFSNTVNRKYMKKNFIANTALPVMIGIALFGVYLLAGFISGSPVQYFILALGLGVLNIIIISITGAILAVIKKFKSSLFVLTYAILIVIQIVIFIFLVQTKSTQDTLYPAFYLVLAFAITVVYALFISKYTPQGMQLLTKIEGFKMYLGAAEEKDLQLMNQSMPKTFEIYQKFLPYAMVLGVETQWTNKFKIEIDKAMQDPNISSHSWYIGGSGLSGFSSSSISSITSSISSAVTSSSTSSEGSSSGGESSGSGSSGGGGGGGGGGGW